MIFLLLFLEFFKTGLFAIGVLLIQAVPALSQTDFAAVSVVHAE